jgi:Cof subfamily protein (haloacid dehalogenase superfamily)
MERSREDRGEASPQAAAFVYIVESPPVIRLICIDVDGTLVGSQGAIAPAVWTGAGQAREAGMRLAICSGRPGFGLARDYAARLDPDGWHVFQNGASVLHLPSGSSRSVPMAAAVVSRLVARARATGRVLEVYADAEYAVESHDPLAERHAQLLGIPFAPRAYESMQTPPVRAQWVLHHPDAPEVLREPHPELELSSSTSPVMPDTTFINMTPAGVSKASAVRTVAAAYGIELGEVMYVGDSGNDSGALRTVGFPVAMGNAEPEVKALARLVVGHVDQGGLAAAFAAALDGRSR